jgi:hypothetical protein
MTLTLTSVLSRAGDVTTAEVDDELVMMRLASDAYFGLDDIGTRIWQLLEQPATAADLCRRLQGEYDVAPEQCERDVLRFLHDLHARGLVNAAGPSAA